MDCVAAQDLIQARLDRELDVERAIELGGHLALCPACREFSAWLEQLCVSVHTLPASHTDGMLARHALARLETADKMTREDRKLNGDCAPDERFAVHVRSNWRWAAGLVACAAVLVGLMLYLQFRAAITVPLIANQNDDAPMKVVPPANPAQSEQVLAKSPERPPQSGQEMLKALIAQHYLAESRKPEAERRKEREHAELLRDLHRLTHARAAASKLLAGEPDAATVWAVAASVSDPATGSEIFAAAVDCKPDLRLVPVYIAALDSVRTRARANEVLCSVSGKKLGPQKEIWLAWWAGARSQVRDD